MIQFQREAEENQKRNSCIYFVPINAPPLASLTTSARPDARKTGLQGRWSRRRVSNAGVSCAREYFCRWYEFAGCARQCARSAWPVTEEDPPDPPAPQRARTPSHWPLARAASRCSAWRPRVGEGSWVADTPQWLSAGPDPSSAGSTVRSYYSSSWIETG